ncbi:protein RIC-3 [Thalassophryne amazonica]|uniref:protein RIC-3 n=1 Tax=Thalassophryne amazonica TaxID=390379 RepID=UPI0014708B25|nr:protein RIC-3 [Thalassophryne amazonica]
MSITTCQKVTLISCSVLCVSLFLPRMLLPRGEKERGQPEGKAAYQIVNNPPFHPSIHPSIASSLRLCGPGFYPPMMHQLTFPEGPEQWEVEKSYSMTHSAEAMAKLQSTRRGKKYNLMAQVIPIYGFGILLYILYIMYKLTCKEKTTKPRSHSSLTKATTDTKTTTECELARLQEELLKTQRLVDRMVSGKGHHSGSSRRSKNKTRSSKKEEKLLKQLRQITLLMQESRLEGASPEMEAEEVPYGVDWEGYPEETYPEHYEPFGRHDACTVMLEEASNLLTAEALAERMEQEEEEVVARKLDTVQEEDEDEEQEEEEDEEEEEAEEGDEEEDTNEEEEIQELLAPSSHAERTQEWVGLEVSRELQAQSGGKKQITFSEHKYIYHYPKEETLEEEEWIEKQEEEEDDEEENDDEEEVEEQEEDDDDDPVMEAERLKFNAEICFNPEAEAEDECVFPSLPAEGPLHSDISKQVEVSGLRMRNRRET